jgi:hypothetical protein
MHHRAMFILPPVLVELTSQRAVLEAVEPAAHQPAASRPPWRVSLGPGAPQEGTVRLRMTASAMRSSHASPNGSPAV